MESYLVGNLFHKISILIESKNLLISSVYLYTILADPANVVLPVNNFIMLVRVEIKKLFFILYI